MANSQEFPIGSMVSFVTRDTGEKYEGIVSQISGSQEEAFIWIKNAFVCDGVDGYSKLDLGIRKFYLNKITKLEVTKGENSRASTNEDGQNSNQDSVEGKMGSLSLDPPSE